MWRSAGVALLGLWAAVAGADGAFMPELIGRVAGTSGVASTEQKGIVIELPAGREALLLQTTYHGPASRFAWVIPVPGRPGRDDVFLASTEFIDALLDHTRPEVRTTITDPHTHMGYAGGQLQMKSAPMAGEAGPAGGPPPTVTVHERMAVGDYDAAVLSATGTQVLADWLRTNGFALPEGAADILGYYVGKQWYFVALKVQPQKAAQRPVLQDVAPVGIRFPTPQLLYPLHISRVSSRDKTAMLLVVLSSGPVECGQLPEARLPLGHWSKRGACYAALRRQALQATSPTAVCEYRGPDGMPFHDLHYQKDTWQGPEGPNWSPGNLWATRLWTTLKREQLQDLTFGPSADQRTLKVVVNRRAEVPRPFYERLATGDMAGTWFLTFAGAVIFLVSALAANRGVTLTRGHIAGNAAATVFLASFVLLLGPQMVVLVAMCAPLLVLLNLARRAREGVVERVPQMSGGEIARGVAVAAGAAAFGYLAWSLLAQGGPWRGGILTQRALGLWRGQESLLTTLLVGALQLVWIGMVVDVVHRGLEGAGRRAVWGMVAGWLVLAVALALLLGSGRLPEELVRGLAPVKPVPAAQAAVAAAMSALAPVTTVALLLLLCFVASAPFAAPRARRFAQPLSQTLLAVALLGCLASATGLLAAHAGGGSGPTRELDAALTDLDQMLQRFVGEHGCYPAKLADLVGTGVPAAGLDSSGNTVPLAPAISSSLPPAPNPPGRGPLIRMPVDPLTGRSDTWVYEPTGSPIIDSGGYEVKIDQEDAWPSDAMRRWRPGAPPPLAAPTSHPPSRSYWQGDRPTALPFTPLGNPDGLFTREHVLHGAGMLRRLAVSERGASVALANAQAHAALADTPGSPVGAVATSPDCTRVVYAVNGPRSTVLSTVGIADYNPKHLVNRPWPVEVYDVSWRPGADQWVVTARDLAGDGRARLYLVGSNGDPRPLTPLDDFIGAQFAPDGGSLLALVAPPEWYGTKHSGAEGPHLLNYGGAARRAPLWPLSAELWRLSLDGARLGRLAPSVATEPLTTAPLGWLAVTPGGPGAGSLLFVSRDNAVSTVALPIPAARVAGLWLGEGEIVAALAKSSGQKMSHPDDYDRHGEIWRYALTDSKWRLLARWYLPNTSRYSRIEEQLTILGHDGTAGAYVLAYRQGGSVKCFAVREREPRLELLPEDGLPKKTLEVNVVNEMERVRVEGVYWPRAFRVGDLFPLNQADEGTPSSAGVVSERTGKSLLVGDQRIPLPPDDLPVIGEPEARCYAKLTRVQ